MNAAILNLNHPAHTVHWHFTGIGHFFNSIHLWAVELFFFFFFFFTVNADVLVMATMGALRLALVLIPFLPGIRDLPRRIPIYKLIWREHYRSQPGA